ncbi:terpene synthase family protein [Actinomadura roseirufa]|uniref:terpene synthase family protein n=1 Tax=Actinomadura roseirufa TaxID=2094049 RepID=UPI00104177C8|nr:terpene synthase family protein [Actinomadura roseirufa]
MDVEEAGGAPRAAGADALARGAAAPGARQVVREVAREVERDLRACAAARPALFPAGPMGPVASRLAEAIAFGALGYTAAELRPAARASLWIFGLDYRIDTLATRATEVGGIVDRCLRVAAGAPAVTAAPSSPSGASSGPSAASAGEDELAAMLAELRGDLADAPAFAEYGPVWREELQRMLQAMAREWTWKQCLGIGLPGEGREEAPARRFAEVEPGVPATLEEYLANADNFGSAWVNVCHWISCGDPRVLENLDGLRAASRVVQATLRLLNDLVSRGREADWGDLNALTLGVSETAVRARVRELAGEVERLLRPLEAGCPRGAAYLRQQLAFSMDFYGVRGEDYWGER